MVRTLGLGGLILSNSRVCSLTIRTSAWQAWLRLTLAAFVLALYTSIALASGVAHADDDPSAPGGEKGKSGATTSQQSGSPASATSATSSQPSQHEAPEAHASADPTNDPPKTTGTSDPTGSDPKPTSTTPAAVDTSTPETPQPTVPDEVPPDLDAAEVDVVPVTPLATDRSNKSKRPTPSASVAAAAASEPEPAVTAAPDVRSARSPVGNAPATSNSSAVVPAADPIGANQSQLGLQVAGLVADVGTVAVSAIHTVANTVAQAFGQDSFLGVPYLLATTVANAAAAVGRTLVGGSLIDPTSGPFTVNYGILDGLGFFNPTKPPAGANDPSISVTPEHPLPVILLNGTIATQGENWSVGAPVLANAGYKVYTFNYGNVTSDPNFPIQSTDDIRQSGLQLAAEVDRVLEETGAEKVILIGHSQGGGILPVYYINNLGGAAKVSQLIGIAPSNHGTDLDGLIALQSLPILGSLFVDIANVIGQALYQQAVTSPFQQEVYGDGDTRDGVLYTTIASMNDEVVTPYTQQALNGPNVTNIVLQDGNPGLVLGHANIITSPLTWAAVLDALASNPAANPLQNPNVVAA
jgi:triacylglycerol esterase/lipase EstA (alpha/beta hydrolase family)